MVMNNYELNSIVGISIEQLYITFGSKLTYCNIVVDTDGGEFYDLWNNKDELGMLDGEATKIIETIKVGDKVRYGLKSYYKVNREEAEMPIFYLTQEEMDVGVFK